MKRVQGALTLASSRADGDEATQRDIGVAMALAESAAALDELAQRIGLLARANAKKCGVDVDTILAV